ncbi:MAG: histone deacetylase family protein [Theionarchaea archaeon]|nr:histone deacetylase family protein [Theionarchaea archaeon]
MNVVYHPRFLEDYPTASCECPDRIVGILGELKGHTLVTPDAVSDAQLNLVHGKAHIETVKKEYPDAYDVAVRAAGGAVKTAYLSLEKPAFGLIRPPGHHASRDSAWGFCFFNNMALSLKMLKEQGLIKNALVLDIDLHFGDGTVNILGGEPWVTIFNTRARDRTRYMEEVESILQEDEYDIIGVSAGFDTYIKDWGGVLTTDDYFTIGNLVKKASEKRFGLLEGGYYLPDLGKNVSAFLKGLY